MLMVLLEEAHLCCYAQCTEVYNEIKISTYLRRATEMYQNHAFSLHIIYRFC